MYILLSNDIDPPHTHFVQSLSVYLIFCLFFFFGYPASGGRYEEGKRNGRGFEGFSFSLFFFSHTFGYKRGCGVVDMGEDLYIGSFVREILEAWQLFLHTYLCLPICLSRLPRSFCAVT